MQHEADIQVLDSKIAGIQATVNEVKEILLTEKSFGDWIPEPKAIELTGIKKSSLLVLRKAGKLTSSTISGKGVFYRRSDFERLLNDNEKK